VTYCFLQGEGGKILSNIYVVGSLLEMTGACPEFFIGGQDQMAEGRERGGVLGEGAAAPFRPSRGFGSAVSAQRFSTIFSTQDGLS